MQEADRKDVERAFGVSQSRFAIFMLPCRLWATGSMKIIMKVVVRITFYSAVFLSKCSKLYYLQRLFSTT